MRSLQQALTTVAGLLLLGSIGLRGSSTAGAQSPPGPELGPPKAGKVQRLSLAGGTQLIGRIVAVTDSSIQFESGMGTSTIARTLIVKVREEAPGTMVNGKYYFPNPNATRLLFSPTGRLLEQGEGYFADHYIILPSFAIGVTDRLTLGGGFSVAPGAGLDEQVWYFTPKVGLVKQPNFNVAVGAWAGSVPAAADEVGTFGILYGVGTWGKPDASFSAGLGYGFANGDLARSPSVLLGAEGRASPRVSFVSENHIFPGGFTLMSAGLRFFGPGFSADFAAMGFSGEGDGFCCVPFLGVLWKW
jgi:hypothetical protein